MIGTVGGMSDVSDDVLVLTRLGRPLLVAEQLAVETVGSLEVEPEWFGLVGPWQVEGNTVTADVVAFSDEGLPDERFRVRMAVERV